MPLRNNNGTDVKTNISIHVSRLRMAMEAVMEKKMRNDFYHRISGITLRMPSLSEHMEDIPRLIEHIEEAIGVSVQDRITDYAPFLSREWSGNVRELFNAVRMYHIGLPG